MHLRAAALCLIALAFAPKVMGNVFANASFENGTWGGAQTFSSPNDATTLSNSSGTVSGWITNIGSTWVESTSHATDGDRMVWLGPPGVGSADCISNKLAVSPTGDPSTQLVAGFNYQLTIDYSFYDPTDPLGTNAALSRFQIYYLLGTNAGGDNPFTLTTLLDTSGHVSAWNDTFGNSALTWNGADVTFAMPDITGFDYLKLFISAPKNTVSNSSRGVLVDNANLHPVIAGVPEPGSLMFAIVASMPLWRRRRR